MHSSQRGISPLPKLAFLVTHPFLRNPHPPAFGALIIMTSYSVHTTMNCKIFLTFLQKVHYFPDQITAKYSCELLNEDMNLLQR